MGDVHHLFPGSVPDDMERAQARSDEKFRVLFDVATLSCLWSRVDRHALRLAWADYREAGRDLERARSAAESLFRSSSRPSVEGSSVSGSGLSNRTVGGAGRPPHRR